MKHRRIKAAEGRHPHPHARVKQQAFNGKMQKFTSQINVTFGTLHPRLTGAAVDLKLHSEREGDY